MIDNFYKKFWELVNSFAGFESNLAKKMNREASLTDAIIMIFTFLLFALVFSFNSL